MDLKDKILNIVNTENKKDPIPDVKLAKMLSTTRENITVVRKELAIGNSRQRREPYLKNAIESILKQNNKMTVADLTKKLMEYGFDISRHAVEAILEKNDVEIKNNINTELQVNSDPFDSLIGYNGSLKSCILQAKSAILYPPFGLPTIISGESGVGKSQFAECMYNFAKQNGIIGSNIPFVVFNCADYSDNPQLLVSLLYGYKKGAFTGADSDKSGIVEQANNGILFLDEIHRLPPKGQEILFSILDRGKFRRLGETDIERDVKILLIGATTENIESSLLLTFRRRIPMMISIPSLSERRFTEKIELIYYFFQQECNRINSKIYVDAKTVEIFTLSKFKGNIGELKSKIQVICARGFMEKVSKNEDIIIINSNEILQTNILEKDLIIEDISIGEIRECTRDMIFVPFADNKFNFIKSSIDDNYSIPKDFYNQIEKRYIELKKLNINPKEMQEILWEFMANEFDKMNLRIKNNKNDNYFSLNELENLLDKKVINMVKKLRLQLREKYFYHELNENVFNYLAIHLEQVIKRIRLKQPIININLSKIKNDLCKEYKISKDFAKLIEQEENILIPDDEIGFISVYIRTITHVIPMQKKVGVILLSHGKIATETIKVVKQLLNVNFPVAIDMPLDENPSSINEKAIEISKIIDEGKGILFLVDMGSLKNTGNIVSKQLGIKTRTVDRVDLLTVIEAVRKASIAENSLDKIYASLMRDKGTYAYVNNDETNKPNAIVSLCLTGEGMACLIKDTLNKKYENINIFTEGMMNQDLRKKIKIIQENYNLIAIIGTINPEIKDVNFIPYDPVSLNNWTSYLDLILNNKGIYQKTNDVIKNDLILFEPNIKNKEQLIKMMCSLLINKGYVKKSFVRSVFNRENIATTFLEGGIAMPHGNFSDIINSSIVFVKLKNTIDWDDGKVNIVCLPALKVNDKWIVKDYLKSLLDFNFIEKIRESKNVDDFKKVILKQMKGANVKK